MSSTPSTAAAARVMKMSTSRFSRITVLSRAWTRSSGKEKTTLPLTVISLLPCSCTSMGNST